MALIIPGREGVTDLQSLVMQLSHFGNLLMNLDIGNAKRVDSTRFFNPFFMMKAGKVCSLPCSLFLYNHLLPFSAKSLSCPKAQLTKPLTKEAARFCLAESTLVGP